MATTPATTDQNLWEVFLNLFRSEEEQARFREDPEQYLAEHGQEGASCGDVQDAATLAWEEVNFAPQSQSGGSTFTSGGNTVHQSGSAAAAPPPSPPPPPAHVTPAEAAVYYVTEHNEYVENHSWIDDRDINQDNSINTQVQANGDVLLDIESDVATSSGDGSVTGQDIEDVGVVNGDGMAFGDAEDADIAVVEGDGDAVANDDGSVNTGEFTGVQESGAGNVTIEDSAVGFGEGEVTNTDVGAGAAVGANATSNQVTVEGDDNAVAVDDSHATTDNDVFDVDADLGLPMEDPIGRAALTEVAQVEEFEDPALSARAAALEEDDLADE